MSIIKKNIKLAEELSHYSHLCYNRGLVGAAGGNLSVRVPGSEIFLVTASGVSLRDVVPGNLVTIDKNCGIMEAPVGAVSQL